MSKDALSKPSKDKWIEAMERRWSTWWWTSLTFLEWHKVIWEHISY